MIVDSSVCYIKKDGAYLMLHRVKKKNDINKDKWIGIGGKQEEGESPYDCIKREVLEETSLRLVKPEYRGIVTFVSDGGYTENMHLFTCSEYEGTPCECDEGNLEWVDTDKIECLPIWEGDKLFLKMIQDDKTPFFSLKLVYSGERLVKAILNGEDDLL